jgi:hypothetical protein
MKAMLEALRLFQIARLEDTYRDLESHATLAPLGKFFIHDLYGRQEAPGREDAVRRVYKAIEDRLGEQAIAGLKRLLRLYRITHEMDLQLVAILQPKLGGAPLSVDVYEAAYRDANAYALRLEQIELIAEAVRGVHRLARHQGVGKALSAFGWVAGALGAKPLVEFLKRGWEAFHAVDDVEPFVALITDRERTRLDRIYGRSAASMLDSTP